MKFDVEGAEWDSLMATPDEVLARIDQMPMELHGATERRFLKVVQKLKRTFHLVSVHYNNYSCTDDLRPFPARAYQVLWVNKRLGMLTRRSRIRRQARSMRRTIPKGRTARFP